MSKKLQNLYDLIHQAQYPGDADRHVSYILEDAEELCNEMMCENKAYLVMELYYACCYMSSRPHKVFKDKAEAEQYAKEGNESEEGKKFIEKFSWDDVEFRFFVEEIESL